MSEVIAVMNQKGGCGKTTTVVNTATSLAVMGKSVLVVDMDPQANATTSFGIDKTKIENTVYDAIIGDINVKKARKILNAYEKDKSNLIQILNEVQEYYGYVPEKAQVAISEYLSMPMAEIYGVVTHIFDKQSGTELYRRPKLAQF